MERKRETLDDFFRRQLDPSRRAIERSRRSLVVIHSRPLEDGNAPSTTGCYAMSFSMRLLTAKEVKVTFI